MPNDADDKSSCKKPAQVALADAILAVCGAIVSLLFVGGSLDTDKIKGAWHHSHRAHAC